MISGRETLEDVNMIVFVGGFSNSDVLGSAKGWAGALWLVYSKNSFKETKVYAENADAEALDLESNTGSNTA